MVDARPDRRIILYHLRVVPSKQYISPLLLVNHESRSCAKAFYNVKVDIYAVPPLSDTQVKSLDKQTHWDRIPGIERAVDGKIHGYSDQYTRHMFEQELIEAGYFSGRDTPEQGLTELFRRQLLDMKREETEYTVDLELHWARYVKAQLRSFGHEAAGKAETFGLTKGALYISPEHDVFIQSYECGSHLYIDIASDMFCGKLPEEFKCRHISAVLETALRERVSTVVRANNQSWSDGSHCVFASDSKILEPYLDLLDQYPGGSLDARKFPSMESYFQLMCEGGPGFLEELMEADGPEFSARLWKWAYREAPLDQHGMTVWDDDRTDDFYFVPQSVNWTRDLMAHWDVRRDDSVRELMANSDINN
ncbi:hypothetical protein DHEL01_v202584 [Diaporthe helianthi]|uniref:Uncharacterized protein n=1 Tax=Diaporthe helianthi TaxID=158607 RepID=A0A2P5I952_DIAHE|nr:hypothetical protein DHEL01_v202584 [Diaporthe helianthi]